MFVVRCEKEPAGFGLSLCDFAGLNCLCRDPHPLDFTAGKFDANALHVWTEAALGVLNQGSSDTTTFLGETFTDDAAAFDGAFACDCADSCHGFALLNLEKSRKVEAASRLASLFRRKLRGVSGDKSGEWIRGNPASPRAPETAGPCSPGGSAPLESAGRS